VSKACAGNLAAHGAGVTVRKDFVQVCGGSAEQCFQLAAEFFAVVARARSAFTRRASIIALSRPDEHYGRHFTVVPGALIISGGHVEPKIFESKA